ncbi:MAG TPA: hypothetical protein VFS21_12905 [Roseiflexaceae bacterium]|nr:hypothetical protein [Roseiflexaceae bacterium]
MENLIEQCIIDENARARVSATIIDILQHIEDHSGDTRSLIISDTDERARFQVDREQTSTLEIKDSTGRVMRSIVVEGIVINVTRPVVLTTNTAMAPIQVN